MSKSKGADSQLDPPDRTTLDLLVALESNETVSQRNLAERLGVALGLTNSLLKRAIRKGLVKVKQAPAKRYAYYVTPKGFGEKSRLVADYLATSLDFFRIARSEYLDVFNAMGSSHKKEIYLVGLGELAEIASLSAHESGVTLAGVIAPGANIDEFYGMRVFPGVEFLQDNANVALVITSSDAPQDAFDFVSGIAGHSAVFAPDFLHISKSQGGA